jgi:carbamate kinase
VNAASTLEQLMMNNTIVVLINGEVLAQGQSSTIANQRSDAEKVAECLLPLFESDSKIVVLHGNKPQVGFVLFRSELASHILHSIPLDVCGADTQGATGYMLSQAFMNVMRLAKVPRRVICVMTQTCVDAEAVHAPRLKAIGPWFDREKAEQYRQTRGWTMVEEPGRGYRRAVPSLPAREILEFDTIDQLVQSGTVVIAAGGGGIPVIEKVAGHYEGIEAVLETEQVAVMLASGLQARLLLCIIEKDEKFALSGISTEGDKHIGLDELDDLLNNEMICSSTVQKQLQAASQFLHAGGEQVIISTLRQLSDALLMERGLRIGIPGNIHVV